MKKISISKGKVVPRGKESEMKRKVGGSNVGKYKNVSQKDMAGISGGAPAGSFPINTEKRAKAALSYSRNAPNAEGIKKRVYSKYPGLKKRHDQRMNKK